MKIPGAYALEFRALARVVVYFNTVTYLKLTSVPKYDGGRVVSSFGGINGMYLGVSFFALFGMLEIVVRAAWLLWRSPPSGPRRPGSSCSDGDAASTGGKLRAHEKSSVAGGMVKAKTDSDNAISTGTAGRMRFRSRIPPPRVWHGLIHEPLRPNRAKAVGPVDRQLKGQAKLTPTSLASLPVVPRIHAQHF